MPVAPEDEDPSSLSRPDLDPHAAFFEGSSPGHAIYPMLGDEDGETGFKPIFGHLFGQLSKAAPDDRSPSAVSQQKGTRPHPFDFSVALELVNVNPHHAACMRAKKKSMVGMGFVPEGTSGDQQADPRANRKRRSKVSKALDHLCRHNLQDVIDDVAEDFLATGTGYMEVVREPSNGLTATSTDEIVGIYHVPAPDTHVFVEDPQTQDYHYQVQSDDIHELRMAVFGDLDGYLERARLRGEQVEGRVSELIAFRSSSSLSEWYGFPSWLSAISAIELARSLHQFTHDFFQNRAVPEFILAVLGAFLPQGLWNQITTAIKAHAGLGNARKTMALNIPTPEAKLQVEKLALEGKSDSREFAMLSDAVALEIVTAHGVPPLLAGIQIPGKLGATNELPNALLAFQLLLVGPDQQTFTSTFDATLGDPELNGGLGLAEGDFILRAITDEIDLATMDTMSRMREPAAGGRDPKEGLKKAEEELEAALGEGWREVLGEVVSETLRRIVARSKAA